MSPKQAKELLVDLIPTGQTVILIGSPGTAKTATAYGAVNELKRNLIESRPATRDPIDFTGLPRVQGEYTTWTRPNFLPKSPNDVLFLDEIGQASPAMQTVCAQLLWEHRAGEHALPEGCSVIGATNKATDGAGVNKILTQMGNRAMWIEIEVSNDDWLSWAGDNGISEIVRAFIRFCPDALYKFDPKNPSLAWPSLRSWEAVAKKVLPSVRPALMRQAVAGLIGEGYAAQFCVFHKMFSELPDVQKILANPAAVKMPTDASVLWATVGALATVAKTAKAPELNNVAAFANRMQVDALKIGGKECGICLVRDCWRIPGFKTAPQTAKFIGGNKDVLFDQ